MTLSQFYTTIKEDCREIERCEECILYRHYSTWKCPLLKVHEQLITIASETGVNIDGKI